MTIQELRTLARHATRGTAPENFSLSSVDAAVADGFKSLTGSINNFMKNRYDIYEIIIENADDVVPGKVMAAMGAFAEIINAKEGEKPLFKRGGLGRQRARKFLTQVGLNGLYETFRLDSDTFTLAPKAIGGAISLDFDRLITGAETLGEFMDVMAETQVDAVYTEVQKALIAAVENTSMPTANKYQGNYSAEALQTIINTVKAYGGAATIFASPEFIAEMGADAIVPGTTTVQGVYHPDDIDAIHNIGRIRIFRGCPVVELRQSFVDENNAQVMIHPQYAYVLPAGKEKIVKVLFEGTTQMYDVINPDKSIEIHTYKKLAVGILAFNNWGIYRNTGINADNWYNPEV